MNKICLIGNSGKNSTGNDGQTAKVRLYLQKMLEEGFDVHFVDLESFIKHPFSSLRSIKKGIIECDRVVLISAENGCRLLIPYINKINKKYRKPFILPLVGSSVLHFVIDKMSNSKVYDFLANGNYSLGKKQTKWSKELYKISYILPETDLYTKVFSDFYSLKNCVTVNNFRDGQPIKKDATQIDVLRVVFLSRINNIKGVFELIEAVNNINGEATQIELILFGDKQLSKEENITFEKMIQSKGIEYKGSINNKDAIETISKFDLLVFPTNAPYEGTPGVITESLLAGTPILTSNFPNAKYLLKDGYDSIFFEMFNEKDLVEKLRWCIANKDKLKEMSKNALESSKRFTYSHERKKFLKYVCGVDE